jgi:hypothetical protein
VIVLAALGAVLVITGEMRFVTIDVLVAGLAVHDSFGAGAGDGADDRANGGSHGAAGGSADHSTGHGPNSH